MKDKIKEAIKRLGDLPPSHWNAAVVFKVKQWLFPRIIAYMDGYRENPNDIRNKPLIEDPEDIVNNANEVFDEKEGEPDST